MEYQTILDNMWATVRYHPGQNYIYHTFHQGIGGDMFRTVMNKGLQALEAHGAQKWLSDDRKNEQFSPDDVKFALSDWGPRAAEAGWKYWALVVPESLAGREGMAHIVEAFHRLGVRVMIFTDLEKARQWLVSL